jgi:hypothetical protein
MESSTKKAVAGHPGFANDHANALRKFRGPLVEYLLSGLEEENKWVRVMALDTLGSVADSRAITAIRPLLVDQDPDIRAVSARAVSQICGRRAGETVLQGDCGSCMIRLVAEESIRSQNNHHDICTPRT